MLKNAFKKYTPQNRTNVQIKGGGGQRPFEQCSKKLHFFEMGASLIQLIKKQFSKFGPKRPWNLEFYFLWFRSSPQRHSNTNNHQNSILSSLPSFPHPPPPSQHSLSVFFIERFHDNNCQKYWNRSIEIICNQTISLYLLPSQRQRVGFFNNRLGRVLDKIPGSGSGSGQVGVSKYTIGYFQVSFLLQVFPGIFFTLRHFQIFLGFPG